MKTFFVLALAVLLALPLPAQDHAAKPTALPELQEWYSWSGARAARISYLPQFYKFGGMNAVTQKRDGRPTWFNRFPFDTANQFTWQDSYFILPGDFNGDGITDYWGSGCYVYRGIAKDSMPDPIPAGQYTVVGARAFIGDYNNDGYDDVFTPRDCSFPNGICDICTINFGGIDLSKMQQVAVVHPAKSAEYWTTIAAYRTSSGKGRVLSYQKEDFVERFVLYGLEVTATGDSIQVSLRELDKVEEGKTDKTQQVFLPQGCYLLRQAPTTGHTLLALNDRDAAGFLYQIEADTFRLLHKFKTIGSDRLSPLRGSINADSVEELITPVLYNSQIHFGIYSGSLTVDTTVKAVILLDKSRYGYMTFALIGDANNDGVNDIAGTSQERNVFVVYLGKDWNATSVAENQNPDFSLFQSEPNPVGDDGKAVLPLSLSRAGAYTLALYDTGGRKIADLFVGELPAGKQRLPLNLTPYSLGSGLYVVRLSDGKATAERAIMIQR